MTLKKKLIILALAFFISVNAQVLAILGNSPEENKSIYGSPSLVPNYNHSGAKNVAVYKDDNVIVTVVYRNKKSILENISYIHSVAPKKAMDDINNYILSIKGEKPLFTSSMDFVNGFFKELIYKNGIKAKVIYNEKGEVKEIISSLSSTNELASENGI